VGPGGNFIALDHTLVKLTNHLTPLSISQVKLKVTAGIVDLTNNFKSCAKDNIFWTLKAQKLDIIIMPFLRF
jgi:hypothetical protein